MTNLLQIARPIPTSELLPLLATYRMMPQFLIETILDNVVQSIHCTAQETAQACQQVWQQWALVTKAQQQEWRSHYGLSAVEFEQLATRSLRIEKFKQQTWGHRLESYFLQRKQDLDQVIYSLLRTQDQDIAQELFFRIAEGEASFAELARQHSEGIEKETGGLLGPVELGTLHTKLANLLQVGRVGEVQALGLGNWCMIVRLEKYIPAQLDESMQQRLLQEKFETWLQTQLQQLPPHAKVWLDIPSE